MVFTSNPVKVGDLTAWGEQEVLVSHPREGSNQNKSSAETQDLKDLPPWKFWGFRGAGASSSKIRFG